MATPTPGTLVVTPDGTKAVVRKVEKVYTGQRGRPAHLCIVQPRNAKGHLVKGKRATYRPAELRSA